MMPRHLKIHAITHLLIKEPLPPGALTQIQWKLSTLPRNDNSWCRLQQILTMRYAFRLVIDDDLLNLIVRETNANAVRVGAADNVKRNLRINNWKVLTKEELMTFLGLLLHTGTIRLNRICDYWKRHYLFNIQCFGQFMSLNRLIDITMPALHVGNKRRRPPNKNSTIYGSF